MRYALACAAIAAAVATVGCNTQLADTEPEGEFGPDSGQEALAEANVAYPEEAQGWDIGDVIAPINFVGYANFMDPSNVGLQFLSLADFYNPDGSASFAPDHPWGKGAKPKAINIVTSAVWCGPCNLEAKTEIPKHKEIYGPKGGAFMTVLLEAGDQSPASFKTITDWATSYKVDYPIVTDPARRISPYATNSLPTNIIVRTSDMRIIKVTPGIPQEAHWSVFEQVLNGESIAGVDG